MSLKYSFRHLFYANKIHKDRLYKLLQDLDTRITSATGSDTDLAEDIEALQTIVGNSTSGLVKDVADLESTVSGLGGGNLRMITLEGTFQNIYLGEYDLTNPSLGVVGSTATTSIVIVPSDTEIISFEDSSVQKIYNCTLTDADTYTLSDYVEVQG